MTAQIEGMKRTSMAEDNYNLIYFVVNKYTDPQKYNTDDLIGAGEIGYTKALNSFDEEKGYKFSTYAVRCIQNEILTYLTKENKYNKNNILLKQTTYSDDSECVLTSVIDTISYRNNDLAGSSLVDILIEKEEETYLYDSITKLSDQEQYIINSRFGLADLEVKTQREIGEELNLSQSYINRIEKQAISKLRKIMKKI